jgi:hypothetical protein
MVLAPQSATIKVDLIDGICKRKAKYPHDKAFALRSVLQRLTAVELPPPDYARPLDKLDETYEELSIILFQAMVCKHLLFVASLNRLPGFPSWMAEWSNEIDPLWLEKSLPRFCESNERRSEMISSDDAVLGVNNSLILQTRSLCLIQTCYAFHKSRGTSHLDERNIHIKNLDVGFDIFRHSHHMQKDMAGLHRILEDLCVPGAPENTRNRVKHWLSFLRSNFKDNTELPFQVLTQNLHKLEIQSSICNEFARGKRQLCWSTSDRQPWSDSARVKRPAGYYYNYTFGICTVDCQIGDKLLAVPGMSMPLVVRTIISFEAPSGARTVSGNFISPAIVSG